MTSSDAFCGLTILSLAILFVFYSSKVVMHSPLQEPVSHIVPALLQMISLSGHYVLEGSDGTPFAGLHFFLRSFPPEYPFKPPGISYDYSKRKIHDTKKICLSMSDFHPESWNPMWSVSSYNSSYLPAT
ncbi:hypothetical protein P3S67_031789 [Capsicum chacoense]